MNNNAQNLSECKTLVRNSIRYLRIIEAEALTFVSSPHEKRILDLMHDTYSLVCRLEIVAPKIIKIIQKRKRKRRNKKLCRKNFKFQTEWKGIKSADISVIRQATHQPLKQEFLHNPNVPTISSIRYHQQLRSCRHFNQVWRVFELLKLLHTVRGADEESKTFSEKLRKLLSLWITVSLRNQHENIRPLADTKREWETALFGLQDYSYYIKKVSNFLEDRRKWDSYISQDGSTIPPSWVLLRNAELRWQRYKTK